MTRPNARPFALTSLVALLALLALGSAGCTGGAVGQTSPSRSEASTSPGVTLATTLRLVPASFRLDAPVQREVAVSDGTTIYIAGGLDASGNSASGVFALDPSTGNLTSLGSMPRAFHDGAGALIGGKLFAFGGGTSKSSDVVQSFDLSSGRGEVVGHLPIPLSDLSAATVGDAVYLLGGWDGSMANATIYATTDGSRFTVAGQLPAAVRYPAVAAVGTDLVIAGGDDSGDHPAAGVYRFDTATGKTTTLADLPAPVGHAAAFTLGGVVYIAGGTDASGAAVGTVTAIDLAAGTTSGAPPLPRPVSDDAVAAAGAEAWLIGGLRGKAVDDVVRASLQTASPASTATGASSTSAPSPTASASPTLDPASARPFAGSLLIADRGNNRLLVLDPQGKIIWRYPDPSLPAPSLPFYFPDDAFWVHGGNAILVNEEGNDVLAEIAYPSGKTLWTYGHPRVGGSGPGYVHQPDDLYPYPGGGMVIADAKNCRILFFGPRGRPTRQIGLTGNCSPGLPTTVGYPNGDTPLPRGHLLITELNGGSISEITPTGHPVWTLHVSNLGVPSDPQLLPDGSYLAADYASPGAAVRFSSTGKVLWTYRPTSGPGMLDHPSLAAWLPNGLIAITDDYNHRVVFIDPKTNKIVWQYGHSNLPGTAAHYLNTPDGLDLLLPGGVTPLHLDFAKTATRAGRP